jgi:protein-arginine kinase activator protein McsA
LTIYSAQYIEAIDEKIKVYMEVDELLQQAVTEERFGDAARLRRQVAARRPE